MYWASSGEVGTPAPSEFTLIRVAQILNCSVFDLLERPLRWRKLALLYERCEERFPAIKDKIENQRRRLSGQDEDD